ncbi:MAG: exodeoxyribonuclease VII small subunit [Ignavibacteria bacterium]|nr:exodeoxyribonuclease VII small subunit [Ignavibacteria bacterium]
MKKKVKEKSFEESFRRLEKILEILESENCTLEETIKLYEEAIMLAKTCSEKINNAELRIKQINKAIKAEE